MNSGTLPPIVGSLTIGPRARFRRAQHELRDRQIHRRARRACSRPLSTITRATFGCAHPRLRVGLAVHDEVSLRADVVEHAAAAPLRDRCPSPGGCRCWRWPWPGSRCSPARRCGRSPSRGCSATADSCSSTSFLPPPSVRPSHSSRLSSPSTSGASAIGALLGLAQRLDAVVEMVDSTRPSSSFIDASSRASIIAGFGAQLP